MNLDDCGIPEIQIDLSKKVAVHANSVDGNFGFDPATILIIVNIIVNLVRLLYICYKDSGVSKQIKNPGRIQRYMIYREVKKSFPKNQVNAVYKGVLKACGDLTESEVRLLMSSV